MRVEKYYEDDDELEDVTKREKKKTEYVLKNSRSILGFFCCLFIRCRSPPLFNLILKKQIERRKERWQNAQKEENIGIIPIL